MLVVLVIVSVGLFENVLFAIAPVAAEKLYVLPESVADVPIAGVRVAGILKYTVPVPFGLSVEKYTSVPSVLMATTPKLPAVERVSFIAVTVVRAALTFAIQAVVLVLGINKYRLPDVSKIPLAVA